MTRKELELFILERLEEIRDAYHEYNPDGNYLAISIYDDKISAWNSTYSKDKKHPVDLLVTKEFRVIDGKFEQKGAWSHEATVDCDSKLAGASEHEGKRIE